ncbi:MAG TPA: carboxypeptidase regulatory-like domain-containing protein [Terriglobales bacterium]|nr:carboxypeptidase regulatory-like domain-containing protein [Terriglobales bacterium]
MKSVLIVVCCWIALLCASADAQNAVQTPTPAVVRGTVVKANTSEPVKKAKVTLYPTSANYVRSSRSSSNEPLTTVTDASGAFEFTGVAPGEYRAVASRSGYANAAFGRHSAGQLISVQSGEQVRNITLRLSPSAAITGRVVDEDGEPMANVNITALQYRYMLHARKLMPVGSTQTDDRGEYRLGELRPGRYFIQAIATANEAPKGMRYATRFFPDANSVDAASPIQIRAGDEADAAFHLAPAKAVNVSGVIVGADPRQHYSLMLSQPGLEFPMRDASQAEVKADGRFIIRDVLPGTYRLLAYSYGNPAMTRRTSSSRSPEDFEPEISMAQQEIEVGDTDVDGIRLNLAESRKRMTEVPGQIRIQSANPKPLDQLRVTAQPTRLESFADFFGMAQGGSGRVNKDGSFTLRLGASSRYFTNINATSDNFQDFYTKSVTYGNRDVTGNSFNVGATAGRLEIVVADDGARIDGTVTDANNRLYPGATIIAIPETQYRDWYEMYGRAETDQKGRFTMRGLRPGDYTLFAWEDTEDGAFMDPDYMRPFEQLGVSVRAKSNGRYEITLKLVPDMEE